MPELTPVTNAILFMRHMFSRLVNTNPVKSILIGDDGKINDPGAICGGKKGCVRRHIQDPPSGVDAVCGTDFEAAVCFLRKAYGPGVCTIGNRNPESVGRVFGVGPNQVFEIIGSAVTIGIGGALTIDDVEATDPLVE